MERDDDDIDLDNVPLVGNRPLSKSLEDAAAVREPRRWDFFVLTVPFFGYVSRLSKNISDGSADTTRTTVCSLLGRPSRSMES